MVYDIKSLNRRNIDKILKANGFNKRIESNLIAYEYLGVYVDCDKHYNRYTDKYYIDFNIIPDKSFSYLNKYEYETLASYEDGYKYYTSYEFSDDIVIDMKNICEKIRKEALEFSDKLEVVEDREYLEFLSNSLSHYVDEYKTIRKVLSKVDVFNPECDLSEFNIERLRNLVHIIDEDIKTLKHKIDNISLQSQINRRLDIYNHNRYGYKNYMKQIISIIDNNQHIII